MTSNPSQLLLLADHVKLSLLERERAISLKLPPNSRDAEISRSLEALREGIEKLERNPHTSSDLQKQTSRLRQQYSELNAQFTGNPTSTTSSTITKPNDTTLSSDFDSAQSRPRLSSLKKRPSDRNMSKSVRFSDDPSDDEQKGAADEANRAALFPYRDNPDEDAPPDHSHLDNEQIHTYHSKVLREQDEQLDRLGESIGRQREIGVRIGDELDEQLEILDDVDRGVDRHQNSLDRAKRRLEGVAKKAKDNILWTVIILLVLILVFLVVVLK